MAFLQDISILGTVTTMAKFSVGSNKLWPCGKESERVAAVRSGPKLPFKILHHVGHKAGGGERRTHTYTRTLQSMHSRLIHDAV